MYAIYYNIILSAYDFGMVMVFVIIYVRCLC